MMTLPALGKFVLLISCKSCILIEYTEPDDPFHLARIEAAKAAPKTNVVPKAPSLRPQPVANRTRGLVNGAMPKPTAQRPIVARTQPPPTTAPRSRVAAAPKVPSTTTKVSVQPRPTLQSKIKPVPATNTRAPPAKPPSKPTKVIANSKKTPSGVPTKSSLAIATPRREVKDGIFKLEADSAINDDFLFEV